MPVLRSDVLKRQRMVNFRLSEEEWAKLQASARDHGARSVGEYIRNVVFSSGTVKGQGIEDALARIERRLDDFCAMTTEGRNEAL